jgi:tagaturonate reductase
LPKKLVFSLAALISFYKGKRGEETIKLADDQDVLDLFSEQWSQYNGTFDSVKAIVTSVLGYEKVWEIDLNQVPGLTAAITKDVYTIETIGMKKAVESILGQKAAN